ncbi:galactokinase, partial [Lunasporangiospora selenospora]
MTPSTIPLIHDISVLYSGHKIACARTRWADLLAQFECLYGRRPDYIARSPGRVNLIGEHIDYAGFGVLPMAIEDDCLIAVATTDAPQAEVRLSNLNPKYESAIFHPNLKGHQPVIDINPENHVWSNYFAAGYRGLIEELKIESPNGMLCLMSGAVPTGAGLSSSSALVCCAVNATVKAQEMKLKAAGKPMPSAHELAVISIRSERYVGTMGGGMDQACSILSKPKSALFIEFHPVLKVTPVTFPSTRPSIAFVIANTLVTSDKAVTAPVRYNLRVVETRGAARILARELGIPIPDSGKVHLKQVFDAYFETSDCSTEGKSEAELEIEKLKEMGNIVERILGTDEIRSGISFTKMCAMAGLSEDEFTRLYIQQPIQAKVFHLYRRAKHVYSEERRVVQFRDICEKALHRKDLVSETLFLQLGELMNASQDSCHNLYDCSCEELEELTALA